MLIGGKGEPGEYCDFVTGYFTCSCRGTVRAMRDSCQRLECPNCYLENASKAGRRVSVRLRGTQYAYRHCDPNLYSDFREVTANRKKVRSIRHIVFSPPPGRIPEGTGLSDAFDVFTDFRKKGHFMIGGVVWFHPYRIKPDIRKRLAAYLKTHEYWGDLHVNDESGGFWRLIHCDVLNLGSWREYVYWSPHFHVLGFGGLPRANVFHTITKWVYKNRGPRSLEIKEAADGHLIDHVKQTASYIASHAGIESGKNSLRYFGICATSKVARVKDPLTGQDEVYLVKKSYLKCPKCGEYLTIHRGTLEHLTDTGQRIESKLVFYKYCITERGKAGGRYASPPVASC